MGVPGDRRNSEREGLAHGRRDSRSLIAKRRERPGCASELQHQRAVERR